MKSGEDFNLQAERLCWKISAKDGITFEEAGARLMERAIRLGPSPANRKFLRIILKMAHRRHMSFQAAASKVWDRAALFFVRKGLRGVKAILGEK